MNTKRSSSKMASQAARILNNKSASSIQKSLSGGVLSQRSPSKQTGSLMEAKASKVLRSEKYSQTAKSLAASLVSQSNKNR